MRKRTGLEDLRVLPRRSLAEEIASTLRERILTGDLQPGERIPELDVAQAFGTSQAPVREAFATLRSEGLVETMPRRGTFVSTVLLVDARTAYEVRRRIEPFVYEHALDKLTDADLAHLDELVERMREASMHGDVEAMTRWDMDLHGLLYDRVGSEMLRRIWDLLSANIRTFVIAAGPELLEPEELTDVPEMHARLVQLIRARDVDGLRGELTHQLDLIWQRIGATESPATSADAEATDSLPYRSAPSTSPSRR